MEERNRLLRSTTAVRKDDSSVLRKIVVCIKPLFKSKIINVDMKYTIWCNFVLSIII